jgi:hypothetical protein
VRWCKGDRKLMARGKHANQVVVAMARELVGCMLDGSSSLDGPVGQSPAHPPRHRCAAANRDASRRRGGDDRLQEGLVLRSGYTFEQATDRHRRTLDWSWVYGWSAFLGVPFPLLSTCQREHDLSKNSCAGCQIRRGSRLGFVVTDPAPARHEQHAAGTEVGHILGVMRCARHHIHMH